MDSLAYVQGVKLRLHNKFAFFISSRLNPGFNINNPAVMNVDFGQVEPRFTRLNQGSTYNLGLTQLHYPSKVAPTFRSYRKFSVGQKHIWNP